MFTVPIIENLKMPTKIKINQQYTTFANNNWPKIRFNHNIVLPILSTIPRGIRSLVLPIKNVVINCPNTQFDPQISSSEAGETTRKPKFQDEINLVQTACNVLKICNMDVVFPSVEEAQDPDGNVTSPVQQGPVFKQEKLP